MSASAASEVFPEVTPGIFGVCVIRNHDENPRLREHLYIPVPEGREAAMAMIGRLVEAERAFAHSRGVPADEVTHVFNDYGDHTVRYVTDAGLVRWTASLSLPDVYREDD